MAGGGIGVFLGRLVCEDASAQRGNYFAWTCRWLPTVAVVFESHHFSVLRNRIFAVDDFGAYFCCTTLRVSSYAPNSRTGPVRALRGAVLAGYHFLPANLEWHLDSLLVLACAHVAA